MNEQLFARQAGLLDAPAFSRLVYGRLLRGLRPAPRLRLDGPGGRAHQEAGVHALAIERFDGQLMVSGGADGTIRLWDLEQAGQDQDHPGAPLAEIPRAGRSTASATAAPGHRFGVTHACFYPFDAAAFLTASFDHSLRLWATDGARLAGVFDLGAKIYRHAVSPVADHLLVACATQHPAVRLVDLRSGAAVQSLVAPGQEAAAAVLAAAWCPSPQRPHVLASGAADGSLRLWDVRRGSSFLDELGQGHAAPLNGLAWTDDGAFLVSAGHDRRLRVWDAASGADTLVRFGPAVRNGGLASAPLLVAPAAPGSGGGQDGSSDLLVWPNEAEILVLGLHDGRTLQRLRGWGARAPAAAGPPRVTSLAWRGAGGLGSDTGGAVLGGRDGPAGGVLFSGHVDGQVRAWAPVEDGREGGEGGDDEQDCFVDTDGGDGDGGAATEERARKRRALDQAYRSLMGTQITFR